MFDTNSIFTKAEFHLFSSEAERVIETYSKHDDLSIIWVLPDIVRHERAYQIQQAAKKLLPHIESLEKLLSQRLNIDEAVTNGHIARLVEEQIEQYGVTVAGIRPDGVNWEQLIHCSVYRLPPFEGGEKQSEKGFRDAILMETFLQIASEPGRAGDIVLVTKDALLSEAVRSRVAGIAGVRIVADIAELEGHLNVTLSNVTEEFVARIRPLVGRYFWEKDNRESLYFREKVGLRIREQFAEVLSELPPGATRTHLDGSMIGKPQFVKKERRRFFWVTGFAITVSAHKSVPPHWSEAVLGVLLALQAARKGESEEEGPPAKPVPWQPKFQEVLAAMGVLRFRIHWSVEVSDDDTLADGRIGQLDHVDTVWSHVSDLFDPMGAAPTVD